MYPVLLGKLATGIFVKESRFTWVVEQRARYELTLASFDANSPQTIEEFLERYNQEIERLVLISNFGFAPRIDQPDSALEKHEVEEHVDQPTGLKELSSLKP